MPAAPVPAADAVTSARVPRGVVTFVVGLLCIGLGVSLSIRAELGVAPYDVLTTGLVQVTGLPIGFAAVVVPFIFAVLAVAIGARLTFGTVLAMVLVGPVIGTALEVLPSPQAMVPRLALLALGFAVVTTGITAVVMADVGPAPPELLMLAIHERGMPLASARTAIEASSVVVGWALGGQIGAGTVAFALLIGPALKVYLVWAGFRPAVAVDLPRVADG